MSTVRLLPGDCREVIKTLDSSSIDSGITDPPYSLTSIVKRFGKTSINGSGTNERRAAARADGMARLSSGFMGKKWDTGEVVHDPAFWAEVYRVLKPGAHLVAFGGTRTYHRMVCAIEDAGFEIRDTLCWLYGTGFPKSHDVSKAIDKAAGAERAVVTHIKRRDIRNGHGRGRGDGINASEREAPEYLDYAITAPTTAAAAAWVGWGTALKSAFEPIVLARKPLIGTVAENVLLHGTGAINIDGCRIGTLKRVPGSLSTTENSIYGKGLGGYRQDGSEGGHNPNLGRWPANVAHDDSDEVLAAFPDSAGQLYDRPQLPKKSNGIYGDFGEQAPALARGDSGSAARFFFSAKADSEDRWGSKHPTVKPVALIRWLMRLVTPPGGLTLDPFAGSGTAGVAALAEGFDAILIEREAEYITDIEARLAYYQGAGGHSVAQKNRNKRQSTGTLL
jgi:DNA modification methylase